MGGWKFYFGVKNGVSRGDEVSGNGLVFIGNVVGQRTGGCGWLWGHWTVGQGRQGGKDNVR